MKKYLFVFAALLICSAAFAQSYMPQDSYEEVYVKYAIKGLKGLEGTENVHNFNSYSVGYAHGMQIVEDVPVFFAAGVEFQYITKYTKNDFFETRKHNGYNFFGTGIPVNFIYMVPLNNSIHFEVNGGINAMYYWTSSFREDGMDEYDVFCRTDSHTYDFPQAHRFQAGWNAGVGFQFAHVRVGIQYNQDFTKLMNGDDVKNRFRSLDFTVGWRF